MNEIKVRDIEWKGTRIETLFYGYVGNVLVAQVFLYESGIIENVSYWVSRMSLYDDLLVKEVVQCKTKDQAMEICQSFFNMFIESCIEITESNTDKDNINATKKKSS